VSDVCAHCTGRAYVSQWPLLRSVRGARDVRGLPNGLDSEPEFDQLRDAGRQRSETGRSIEELSTGLQ
jgi:hypothetical protein